MKIKEYKNFELADFLADEEFRLWVLKNNDQLDYFWKKWLQLHPEKETTVAKARELIVNMKFTKTEVEKDERDTTLEFILKGERSACFSSDMKNNESMLHRDKKVFWLRIAASVILIATFSIVFFVLKDKDQEVVQQVKNVVKENPKGQKLTCMLPDGSKVILNAESKITFPEHFDKNFRKVELEGEAYFEVAKDERRPFTVETGHISTTALGTIFNVNAFPHGREVAVSLLEGKVKIVSEAVTSGGEIFLEPGEKVSIDHATYQAHKTHFDVLEDFGWKDGVLVFNGDSFESVKAKLERWYGVSIKTLSSPGNMEIKGRFDNLSLEEVLSNLHFTNGIEYKIEEKVVTINFKN